MGLSQRRFEHHQGEDGDDDKAVDSACSHQLLGGLPNPTLVIPPSSSSDNAAAKSLSAHGGQTQSRGRPGVRHPSGRAKRL